MQTLDIISVNIWHIVISLANLVLLFLIIKRFLYKPVKKVLAQRQAEIDKNYENARQAEQGALNEKLRWEEKMSTAKKTADDMIANAASTAQLRGDRIISDAKTKAEGIVRRAEEAAKLEIKNAHAEIKKELVEVSSELAEKLIKRELSREDHQGFIDSFIDGLGDGDE
ncbi:MAG: F0F1 ATP synthase subunit B [Clostridia bacterium]|nr:F0F1 ATP synthase subunit B [Clostridia bacterium]